MQYGVVRSLPELHSDATDFQTNCALVFGCDRGLDPGRRDVPKAEAFSMGVGLFFLVDEFEKWPFTHQIAHFVRLSRQNPLPRKIHQFQRSVFLATDSTICDMTSFIKPQYQQVADTLRERIEHGDYLHTEIPAVRRLAMKMNVSHIVARKAVESLIKDGLLAQQANGRLMPRTRLHESSAAQLRIAFLAPAFASGFTTIVRIAVEQVVAEFNGLMRPVDYVHWNDQVIEEVLESFDGVVLLASTEPLPESTLRHLTNAAAKVVTVDLDLTVHKIPCVSLFRATSIQKLINHLAGLGHKEVDCFNTQPICQEIRARIESWRSSLTTYGLSGNLINEPVKTYDRPIVRAYTEMGRLLDDGFKLSRAIFFTNESAAKGAMRALSERGIRIGTDISICAIGDLSEARFLIPSLTSVEMPDATLLLRPCLRWMEKASAPWKGPLMVEAPQIFCFIGESTGVPKSGKLSHRI